jgi:DNA repair exonuclease SbcCD nuclease subunit
VSLLKRYCLGDAPVALQLLSEEKRCFASGRCNYLDPDLNVGLPVFTIHGNHDDATGSEYTSAVDVLSAAGLVNYFGKVVRFCSFFSSFWRLAFLLLGQRALRARTSAVLSFLSPQTYLKPLPKPTRSQIQTNKTYKQTYKKTTKTTTKKTQKNQNSP